MARNELIEKLSEQLNLEVITYLCYTLQATFIRGAQYESVRKMYLSEVMDEVSHAQYLLNQIVILGGKPVLTPDQSAHSKEIKKILKNDGARQSMDVNNYTSLTAHTEKAQLIALKIKMEKQATDDDGHIHEMRRLLSGIC